MKKTHVYVRFGFVSSIIFFEHNNLLSLIIYLCFIDIKIIIIIVIYLLLIYVKSDRDAVFCNPYIK